MNKIIGIIAVVLIIILGIFFFTRNSKDNFSGDNLGDSPSFIINEDTNDEEVFCTLDALACPDGSFVGRVAPDCEFEACPVADSGAEDNQFENDPYYGEGK